MNPWDKDNLDFLLYANRQEFEAWMDQATQEEVTYALQLMDLHKTALKVAEMELMESEENFDYTEALSFINRVKEKL
jgi:hypothetical protein